MSVGHIYAISVTFGDVENTGDAAEELDVAAFGETVERVQAYVRSEPGAWGQLADAARDDPEGMTKSLLALGTVLLDIAAGAFELDPHEMLDKVSRSISLHEEDELARMGQQ